MTTDLNSSATNMGGDRARHAAAATRSARHAAVAARRARFLSQAARRRLHRLGRRLGLRLGLGLELSLSVAERQAFGARIGYLDAWFNLASARVSLDLAVGG